MGFVTLFGFDVTLPKMDGAWETFLYLVLLCLALICAAFICTCISEIFDRIGSHHRYGILR